MDTLLNFFAVLKPSTVNLLLIPFSLIKGYIIMLLSTYILKINTTTRRKLRFVILYAFFSYIIFLFLKPPHHIIVNIVIMTLLITHIFRVSILKGFLYQAIHSPLSLSIQLILTKIFLADQGICIHILRNSPGYSLLVSICIYLSLLIAYYILKKTTLNISILDTLSTKNRKQVLLFFLYNILFSISVYLVVYYYIASIPFPLVVLIFIILLYFIANILSSISMRSKLLNLNIRLKQAELYTETLENLQDNLRGFKHDFSNIIQSIGGYTSLNDLNGLKEYYKEIKKDCNEINSLSTLNPNIINNPAVYNLITSKYNSAIDKGIDFNVEVFIDLNELCIPIYKFVRILGIFLDNAIESAKDCEDKVINLRIFKQPNINKQIVIIENTYNNKDVNIDEIFKKGFSTKENNTGLGLWEVRKILKTSTNLNLHTTKNDKYFVQQFEIFMPK